MSSPPISPRVPGSMKHHALRGPREPTNFTPRAPVAAAVPTDFTTPATELKKTFSKLISGASNFTGTKKGNRPDFGDLDERIARYKERKEREKVQRAQEKENSKKIDLGPALGQFDTPNVRERIRKWQATGAGVVSGDPLVVLPPPIVPFQSPAGSIAGSDCGRSEYSSIGCGVGRLRGSPDMSPSRPPKEIMKEWETASESGAGLGGFLKRAIEEERKALGLPDELDETEDEEKMLQRQRGRDREAERLARERERKLRRRSRGPPNSVGAGSGIEDSAPLRIRTTKKRKNGEETEISEMPRKSDGLRLRGDDDGIRVRPRRKRSRRKDKEFGGVTEGIMLEEQTAKSEGGVPLPSPVFPSILTPLGGNFDLFDQDPARDSDAVRSKREAYEQQLKAERDKRAERRKTFSTQPRQVFGHPPTAPASFSPPHSIPLPHSASVLPSTDVPPPPPVHTSILSLRKPEEEEEIELMKSEPLPIPMSPSPPPVIKSHIPPSSPPRVQDFAPARFEDPGIRIYPSTKGSRQRRTQKVGEQKNIRGKKGHSREVCGGDDGIGANIGVNGGSEKINRPRRRRPSQTCSENSVSNATGSTEEGNPRPGDESKPTSHIAVTKTAAHCSSIETNLPTRLKETPKPSTSTSTTTPSTFPRVRLKPTPIRTVTSISSTPPPKVALRPVPPKPTSLAPNSPPTKVTLPKVPPRTPVPPSIANPTSSVSTPPPKATEGGVETPVRVTLPRLTSTLQATQDESQSRTAPCSTQQVHDTEILPGFDTSAPPPPPPPPPSFLAEFMVPASPMSKQDPKVLPGGLVENPNVPGTFLSYRRNPPLLPKKNIFSKHSDSNQKLYSEAIPPLSVSKERGGSEKADSVKGSVSKKASIPLGSAVSGKADFASVIEEIRLKIKEREEMKKTGLKSRKGSVLRSSARINRIPSTKKSVQVGRAPSIRHSSQVTRSPSKRIVPRSGSKKVRLPSIRDRNKGEYPVLAPKKQTSQEFKSLVDGYESDILETMKSITSEVRDSRSVGDEQESPPPLSLAPLRISRPCTPARSEVPVPLAKKSGEISLGTTEQKREMKQEAQLENSHKSGDSQKVKAIVKDVPQQTSQIQVPHKASVCDTIRDKATQSVKHETCETKVENEKPLMRESTQETTADYQLQGTSPEILPDELGPVSALPVEGSISPPVQKPILLPSLQTHEPLSLQVQKPIISSKLPTEKSPSPQLQNSILESAERPKDILEQMADEALAKEKEKEEKRKHRKKKNESSSKSNGLPKSSNVSFTESYLSRTTPRSSTTTLAKDASMSTPPPIAVSPNITPPRGTLVQSHHINSRLKEKHRDRPPKLSEMTSAFFKALRQEFQGVSVKAGEDSSESEVDEHGISFSKNQAEVGRVMEEERQREIAIEQELEQKRQIQWEREMEMERERQRAIELELELEKEREKQLAREKEFEEQRKKEQEEEERWRMEVLTQKEKQRELEREIEKEKGKEKIKHAELERDRRLAKERRLEVEREKERRRQLELEMELERQKKRNEDERQRGEKQGKYDRVDDTRRQSMISSVSLSLGVTSPPPQRAAKNGQSSTSSNATPLNREFTPSPSVTTAKTSPPPSRGPSLADSKLVNGSISNQIPQPETNNCGPDFLHCYEVTTPMAVMHGSSSTHTQNGEENSPSLKKYTSHTDLISMLSVKDGRSNHHTSAHARSNATTATALTIPELIEELITAEKKYMRELKTLVDDVIPVLLSTVLERADNQVAARQQFGAGALSGKLVNPTRPIVDMGIALERIKRLHESIPKKDADMLLKWAQDGRAIYEDYLKAWRMGFQDVIVTMASDEEYDFNVFGWDAESRKQIETRLGSFAENPRENDSKWEMPPLPEFRPEEEEKVDVAFLLKRPLVRLRILAKVMKRIDSIRHSPLTETCAISYQNLVNFARKKVSDEKARIEDEAAASIDVSKAFDIHTFAPMSNITLSPTRKVRARDCFIMHMPHSSGQMMQRNVEFILRDEGTKNRGSPKDSEILICEVPVIGRLEKWLLFQPIPLKSVSARTGDDAGEIVVMVRGKRGNQPEWCEVMVLKTTNDIAAFEWVQMLGLLPVPPVDPFEKFRVPPEDAPPRTSPSSSVTESRVSIPETVRGRASPQARDSIRSGGHTSQSDNSVSGHTPNKSRATPKARSVTPPSREHTITPIRSPPLSRSTSLSLSPQERRASKPRPMSMQELPSTCDDVPSDGQHSRTVSMSSIASTVSTLKRSAAIGRAAGQKRRTKSVSSLASIPSQRPESPAEGSEVSRRPSSTRSSTKSKRTNVSRKKSQRSDGLSDITEEYSSQASNKHPSPETKRRLEHVPLLAPTQLQNIVQAPEKEAPPEETPPPPPPHRVLTPSSEKQEPKKIILPPPVSPVDKLGGTRRRISSPLKHEYEPSTASEEADSEGEEDFYSDEQDHQLHNDVQSDGDSLLDPETDSDAGSVTDSETASAKYTETDSETGTETESESEESFLENENPVAYPEPTLEIDPQRNRIVKAPITPIPEESEVSMILPKQRKTSSQPSEKTETSVNLPPAVYKGLAYLFSWSANAWQKFHPDECKIIVTSGRIEAFPNLGVLAGNTPLQGGIAKERSGSPSATSLVALNVIDKPLVIAPDAAPAILSLELTPTTPIRRGTAVDLSIRTPLTSQFCGNSVMFRCRSPGECEALYNAINSARISHQTYHPLPNINKYHSYLDPDGIPIPPVGPVKRGWGPWGRSSYRACSSRVPSIISSEGSVGSFSSAFSVFKRLRFGKGSSAGSSFGSFASETSTASSLPGLVSGLPGVPGGPISMSGLKIRLYKRESASKWRDLGPARLSILKPPLSEGLNRAPEEKRIVVRDKSGKVVLLDETLGEQSFERVARTGIAVSILVGELGPDGQKGISGVGGLGAKNTVYMLQMKSEAETVYTFSIVGKHRY